MTVWRHWCKGCGVRLEPHAGGYCLAPECAALARLYATRAQPDLNGTRADLLRKIDEIKPQVAKLPDYMATALTKLEADVAAHCFDCVPKVHWERFECIRKGDLKAQSGKPTSKPRDVEKAVDARLLEAIVSSLRMARATSKPLIDLSPRSMSSSTTAVRIGVIEQKWSSAALGVRQDIMSEAPRPGFPILFMDFAKALTARSTCRRLQVGCVIASPDFRRMYAMGYNGNATGLKNDCDLHGPEAVGKCGCLHAEENAVINCDVPRELRKFVFCTHLPCVMCAKRLINLGGVERVYFDESYRSTDSFALFEAAKIECVRLVRP